MTIKNDIIQAHNKGLFHSFDCSAVWQWLLTPLTLKSLLPQWLLHKFLLLFWLASLGSFLLACPLETGDLWSPVSLILFPVAKLWSSNPAPPTFLNGNLQFPTPYTLRFQANSFLLVLPSKAASSPASQGQHIYPSSWATTKSVICDLSSFTQIMAVLPFNYLWTPTPHHNLTSLKVIPLRHNQIISHITQAFQRLVTPYRIKAKPHFWSSSLLHSHVPCVSF